MITTRISQLGPCGKTFSLPESLAGFSRAIGPSRIRLPVNRVSSNLMQSRREPQRGYQYAKTKTFQPPDGQVEHNLFGCLEQLLWVRRSNFDKTLRYAANIQCNRGFASTSINLKSRRRKRSQIRSSTQPSQYSPVETTSIEEEGTVFKTTRSKQIDLSTEQKHVLQMVLDGESVFFTGAAGTGKSVLLREIIRKLVARRARVAITASTGIAAVNVGGQTLHSFAGVGLGNQHAYLLLRKAKNQFTMERWRNTDVLIIDEISMVDARLFDVLSEIGKAIREDGRPFGGIQLVVCGDFFQLPPVPLQAYIDSGIPVSFAFEAECWDEALPNTIALTKVFRQRQPELVDMLNDMRQGVVSKASSELLYSLSRKLKYTDGIHPTEIFPLRRLADATNQKELSLLPGQPMLYKSDDEFGRDIDGQPVPPKRGKLILDKMIMSEIVLKVGAQVMCVQNIPDAGIVNGSVGVIVRFSLPHKALVTPEVLVSIPNADPKWKPGDKAPKPRVSRWEKRRWPVVQYHNGKTVMMTPFCFKHENANGDMEARREQVPLILAWALTVHKAQGKTLERVKVDLEGTFEKGQAYVAISRCTTLEGLEVQHFSPACVFAHPKVIRWASSLAVISDGKPNSRESK